MAQIGAVRTLLCSRRILLPPPHTPIPRHPIFKSRPSLTEGLKLEKSDSLFCSRCILLPPQFSSVQFSSRWYQRAREGPYPTPIPRFKFRPSLTEGLQLEQSDSLFFSRCILLPPHFSSVQFSSRWYLCAREGPYSTPIPKTPHLQIPSITY